MKKKRFYQVLKSEPDENDDDDQEAEQPDHPLN